VRQIVNAPTCDLLYQLFGGAVLVLHGCLQMNNGLIKMDKAVYVRWMNLGSGILSGFAERFQPLLPFVASGLIFILPAMFAFAAMPVWQVYEICIAAKEAGQTALPEKPFVLCWDAENDFLECVGSAVRIDFRPVGFCCPWVKGRFSQEAHGQSP